MTIPEAIACLRAAPSDSEKSAVNPQLTRHAAVEMGLRWVHELRLVGREPDGMIAKRILQIMQDTNLEPVPVRFTHNELGDPIPGWNQQESDMIKWQHQRRAFDEFNARNAERMAQWSNGHQHPAQATTIADINLSPGAYARIIARYKAARGAKSKPPARPAQQPTPRAPEPKPDLSSPTFVLKRPRSL